MVVDGGGGVMVDAQAEGAVAASPGTEQKVKGTDWAFLCV